MGETERVYLDAASIEPLHPAARAALHEAQDQGWADPDRLYSEARRARLLLDEARAAVADGLGARADEVSFTASHVQSLHLATLGLLAARRRVSRHFVTSAVEHSAVLHAAESHVLDGGTMTVIEVDRHGRLDVDAFGRALAADGRAAAACLQVGNHEVGTLQPVGVALSHARRSGVPVLLDAGQAAGRVPIPAGWSALAAGATSWGGPAGVGVLAVRTSARYRTPLPMDEHEHGRVPGLPAVPAIFAAAAALQATLTERDAVARRQHDLVERIRRVLAATVPDVEIVGHPTERLPHLVTFSCLYVDGESLLGELDRAGFAVNSGSSCTSSTVRPSHVLEAMGVLTHGNVRVSLCRTTTAEQVDRFLRALPPIVARLRAATGADRL